MDRSPPSSWNCHHDSQSPAEGPLRVAHGNGRLSCGSNSEPCPEAFRNRVPQPPNYRDRPLPLVALKVNLSAVDKRRRFVIYQSGPPHEEVDGQVAFAMVDQFLPTLTRLRCLVLALPLNVRWA